MVSNSDKDSGTSFFFHSTLFHNGGLPEEEPEAKAVGDDARSTTSTTSTSTSTSTTTTTTTPRDDQENEIVGEKKREVGGVDDGLLQ